ncbi:transposon-encoded TnpW family protein [Chakrabartyella piscis]|uniref:transposon-encoded TnpW family protein n=1 Tax=Chakrabartyella piscis TaxID=2918914 RepID=UPI00295867E9|nr:transposon-encoded TnpW family protein [Chakrabartyella piscis]
MENQTQTKETTTSNSFTKQIGKTTYFVNVHFSETSKETLQDKMERLIKNECVNLENQK